MKIDKSLSSKSISIKMMTPFTIVCTGLLVACGGGSSGATTNSTGNQNTPAIDKCLLPNNPVVGRVTVGVYSDLKTGSNAGTGNGLSTSDYYIERLEEKGMTTFNGANVWESTNTSGSGLSISAAQLSLANATNVSKSYSSNVGGVGYFYGDSGGGFVETFNPPMARDFSGMAIGQARSFTGNLTRTGPGLTPQTIQVTYQYVYMGQESISVPAGVFQTCHMQQTSYPDGVIVNSWTLIDGLTIKSVMDLTINGVPGQNIQELISGTINGVAVQP